MCTEACTLLGHVLSPLIRFASCAWVSATSEAAGGRRQHWLYTCAVVSNPFSRWHHSTAVSAVMYVFIHVEGHWEAGMSALFSNKALTVIKRKWMYHLARRKLFSYWCTLHSPTHQVLQTQGNVSVWITPLFWLPRRHFPSRCNETVGMCCKQIRIFQQQKRKAWFVGSAQWAGEKPVDDITARKGSNITTTAILDKHTPKKSCPSTAKVKVLHLFICWNRE